MGSLAGFAIPWIRHCCQVTCENFDNFQRKMENNKRLKIQDTCISFIFIPDKEPAKIQDCPVKYTGYLATLYSGFIWRRLMDSPCTGDTPSPPLGCN